MPLIPCSPNPYTIYRYSNPQLLNPLTSEKTLLLIHTAALGSNSGVVHHSMLAQPDWMNFFIFFCRVASSCVDVGLYNLCLFLPSLCFFPFCIGNVRHRRFGFKFLAVRVDNMSISRPIINYVTGYHKKFGQVKLLTESIFFFYYTIGSLTVRTKCSFFKQ
jgi:hypothetical protein